MPDLTSIGSEFGVYASANMFGIETALDLRFKGFRFRGFDTHTRTRQERLDESPGSGAEG